MQVSERSAFQRGQTQTHVFCALLWSNEEGISLKAGKFPIGGCPVLGNAPETGGCIEPDMKCVYLLNTFILDRVSSHCSSLTGCI